MECYYRSKPEINGYQQRIHTIWRDRGLWTSKQRLMDQQSQIRKKQWLTNLEIEEIQRIEDEQHGHIPSDTKSKDEQRFLGFNEKGGDVFLNDVREVVEDIGNQYGNVEFGFKIKEEMLEDEQEMLKNMSDI